MPTSYTHHQRSRPIRYRTPSPPRDAVEPISPKATASPRTGAAHDALPHVESQTSLQTQPVLGIEPHQSGHRSNGSMEIFADIALSTHLTTQAPSSNRTRKRLLHEPDINFLPSKRSRSEKLPSPEMSRKQIATAIRPATSYEQTPQSRMMEAELLLNFSNRARLACLSPKAPKTQATRNLSPAQCDPVLESSSLNSSSRQTEENSKVPNMPSQLKTDRAQQFFQSDREDHGTTVALPQNTSSQGREMESIVGRFPSAKESTPPNSLEDLQRQSPTKALNCVDDDDYSSSSSAIPDTASKPISPQPKSIDPQGSVQEDFGNHGSCIMHGALDDQPFVETDMDPMTANIGMMDESLAEDIIHQNPIFDDAPSKEAVGGEKSRSAAFCAACKFQRNLSCVEVENNATSWISCDGCKSWFHFACAGFKNEREVRAVDKFRCKKCKPFHGPTTYVRKSSRAHSAIDYAGLHQGVIKTSDERMEHHYIQPIKDGVITFAPESFARMRPELVTAEFFEKSGGMKEPVVIPADLNPRPPSAPTAEPVENSPHGRATEIGETGDYYGVDLEYQTVLDEGQDALDMVVPQGLTVRQVAELYGPEEKVEVIDVKSQNGENKKWNMRRWAEYYENPNNKVVRNVISLEVSQSKLGRLIRRPKIVRDLDLQDSVWPEELLAKGEYPRVQFYCLMSVTDCFTDFHIDFGGSSVFYHILKGKKTFLFIPPKEKHLKKYEEWCMSPAQNWTFLADQTKECYRVDLSEGDTMLIPSGWIHAVWTPEDSLVIGGNFLTRMNFGMQLRIAQVEKATGVARKFRYPHFQKLHWYTAFRYMEEDPLPNDLKEEFHSGEAFPREQPIYYDFDAWGENSRPGNRNYNARYYSQGEIEGLRDLTAYLLRTVLIELGHITEGISTETRNAVRKSIPRGHGEPHDVVKDFAAWCTWKRGNELLPHWAYPDAKPEDSIPPEKLSTATMKKLDREAALEAALQAPRRQSARRQSLQRAALASSHHEPSDTVAKNPSPLTDLMRPVSDDATFDRDTIPLGEFTNNKRRTSSGAGPVSNRKTACEACRKRRRACKHKDQVEALSQINNLYRLFPQDDTIETESFSQSVATDRSDLGLDGVRIVVPKASNTRHVQVNASSYPNIGPSQKSSEEVTNGTEGGLANSVASGPSNTGVSRPRTKACNDCRKSKRRCIHDAFGNEDPVKVAEQAIPRPHARKSHKPMDPQAIPSSPTDEQSLWQQESRRMAPIANMIAPTANMVAAPPQSTELRSVMPKRSLDKESLSNEPTVLISQAPMNVITAPAHVAQDQVTTEPTPMVAKVPQDARLDRKHEALGVDEAAMTEAPTAMEQPPPSSSLISPPASSNDDIGSSPLTGTATYSPSPPPSKHLPSQATKEMHQRSTPESGSLRRASSSSFEQQRQDGGQSKEDVPSLPAASNEPRMASSAVTDQESLRLIKELQVQDYGLRRRAKS